MKTGSMQLDSRPGTWKEQFVDVLGAAAWAAGISLVLFDFRSYDTGFWPAGFLSLAAAGLVALLSRRWWLVPVVLASLGVAGSGLMIALVYWRPDNAAKVIKIGQQTVFWYQSFFRLAQPAPEPHLLLTFGLILPVAIILYAIVATVDSIWVYLGLCAGLLLPVLIAKAGSMPDFLVVLAAFFIQVPRFVAREVRRKQPRDTDLRRFAMQGLAVPVVVTCIVLANLLVPVQTMDWRFAPLANWIQDWEDLWRNRAGTGRSLAPFNLAYYGYGNTSMSLGGPVIQNETLVLKVMANRQVLLKGSSRTIYSGHSWNKATMHYYRLASPLWQGIRRDVFADPLAKSPVGRKFSAAWATREKLTLTTQVPQTVLFAPGTVQTVKVEDALVYAPYFTPDGDLFTFTFQPTFFSYTVESHLLNRRLAGFDQAMLAAEQDLATEAQGDPNWRSALAGNLQLPAELPESVRQTAAEVTANAATPYAKALLLEQFLRDYAVYTLQPAKPPQDADFVDYFLTTREGHCVYYATAMAVMARTLGIPARYTEGLTLDMGERAGEYRATGQNAHAWAELYFQGVGWLVFDPTPAAPVKGATAPEENEPAPSPPAITPAVVATGPEPGSLPATQVLLVSLLLILLPILAVQLAYRLALHRHRLSFVPDRISRRYPDPGLCLEFYYQDILRQLACLDLAPEAGETLPQFARRAEPYVKAAGLPLPELLWPVSGLHYGDKLPTPGELARLASLRQVLETRLKANLPPVRYFFKRVLVRS